MIISHSLGNSVLHVIFFTNFHNLRQTEDIKSFMLDIQKLNKTKEEKETKFFDEQRKSNQLAEKIQDLTQKLRKTESDLKDRSNSLNKSLEENSSLKVQNKKLKKDLKEKLKSEGSKNLKLQEQNALLENDLIEVYHITYGILIISYNYDYIFKSLSNYH